MVAAAAAGLTIPIYKTSFPVNNRSHSGWKATGVPTAGATPTTAVTCDRTTVGALAVPAPAGSNTWHLMEMWLGADSGSTISVLDRLAHMGGLSGTSTSAQTVGVSLPARWTDYDTVQVYLEVYTALGSTAVSATISYTNQDGTSGRTGSLPSDGSSYANANMFMGPFTLADGDTGVQSVQSVTLSASTGTAGNFGITLARQLAVVPCSSSYRGWRARWTNLGLPDLSTSPCLMFASTGSVNTLLGGLRIGQGAAA